VLTVSGDDGGVTIEFRDGDIVGASSERADLRVIRSLFFDRLIERSTYTTLLDARRDTGMPAHELLGEAPPGCREAAWPALERAAGEVLFELLLSETGHFQFVEIPISAPLATGPRDRPGAPPGTEAAVSGDRLLDAARQVDEYRDILRRVGPRERVVVCAHPRQSARPAPGDGVVDWFLSVAAARPRALGDMLDASPWPPYHTLRAFARQTESGVLVDARPAAPMDPARQPTPHAAASRNKTATPNNVYASFRRTMRRMMVSSQPREKFRELMTFCREHFSYGLLLSVHDGRIVRRARVDTTGTAGWVVSTQPPHVSNGPVFSSVLGSQTPFFGNAFRSQLLDMLGEHAPGGDCAIVSLGGDNMQHHLLYVACDQSLPSPGPFHYLEILSWQVAPPLLPGKPAAQRAPTDGADEQHTTPRAGDAPGDSSGSVSSSPRLRVTGAATSGAARQAGTATIVADNNEKTLARIVASIREIPPMPDVVTRVLRLLADRDSSMNELTETLSRDQAIVARLIKVSNSALYGRGHRITSLQQAVVRLGARTIQSLVLASSTRTLFPMDRTNVGLWGQALWTHSMECGISARLVAERCGYDDPEEAFVGGVLHDVGKVVILLEMPDAFRRIQRARILRFGDSAAIERDAIGFDHTQVGDMLLEKWALPATLRTCVRSHHDSNYHGDCEVLVHVVRCANVLCKLFGSQADDYPAPEQTLVTQSLRSIGLDADRLETLGEELRPRLLHGDFLD